MQVRPRDREFREKAKFIIFATLDEEIAAVRKHMYSMTKLASDVALNEYACTLNLGEGRLSDGILCQPHATGRVEAAILTSFLLTWSDPEILLLVGIAGAFRRFHDEYWKNDISLGDVVIADAIIDTEFQKITDDGPIFRDRHFEIDQYLIKEIDAIYNLEKPKPISFPNQARSEQMVYRQSDYFRVHIGPVISANKVIASTQEQLSLGKRIAAGSPYQPLAVEMESIGVAMAALRYGIADKFVMVRSINDYANKTKNTDEEIWRDVACANSAAFSIDYLKKALSKRNAYYRRPE